MGQHIPLFAFGLANYLIDKYAMKGLLDFCPTHYAFADNGTDEGSLDL
jgi:hypothetical protein